MRNLTKKHKESLLDDSNKLINNSIESIKESIIDFIVQNYYKTDVSRIKISDKPFKDKYSVNYDGNLYITNFDITSLTNGLFKFGEVSGNFDCGGCKSLISLKGAPKKVNGYFNCSECSSLKSLKGAPKEVGSNFYCRGCNKQFTEEDVRKVSKVKSI